MAKSARSDRRKVPLELWLKRQRGRRAAVVAVSCIVLACMILQAQPWAGMPNLVGRRWPVVGVVDERTVSIDVDGRRLDIVLLGVRVPSAERQNVRRWLAERCDGATVMLEFDPAARLDSTGRRLAYIYCGDTLLNEQIIKDGLALADDRAVHRLSEWFTGLERGAQRIREQRSEERKIRQNQAKD